MQFDASLLPSTFRRTWNMIVAMPGAVLVAWLSIATLGVIFDVASERSTGFGGGILFAYGLALTFAQIWITREALEHLGFEPALSVANAPGVYLQGVLVGLGIVLGFLLFVLPGLYVFGRWYLSNTLLILHGGGRRAAMQRSWDMLETRWPAALGVGLIMFVVTLAPLLAEYYPLPFAAEYPFAALLGVNLVSAVGVVSGYLAAVALLVNIEQPASKLQEIFS